MERSEVVAGLRQRLLTAAEYWSVRVPDAIPALFREAALALLEQPAPDVDEFARELWVLLRLCYERPGEARDGEPCDGPRFREAVRNVRRLCGYGAGPNSITVRAVVVPQQPIAPAQPAATEPDGPCAYIHTMFPILDPKPKVCGKARHDDIHNPLTMKWGAHSYIGTPPLATAAVEALRADAGRLLTILDKDALLYAMIAVGGGARSMNREAAQGVSDAMSASARVIRALLRAGARPVEATEPGRCALCGELMPEGEEMFKFHGYSGPCPGRSELT